jgi:hypothetical protein
MPHINLRKKLFIIYPEQRINRNSLVRPGISIRTAVLGPAQPSCPIGLLCSDLSVSWFHEKTTTFPFPTNAYYCRWRIHRATCSQLAFFGRRGLLQRGCAAPDPHPALLRAVPPSTTRHHGHGVHRVRKGRPAPTPGCTLGSSRRPPDLSLLATVVPHQVGTLSPTTLCFKCFMRFRLMFQVFHLDVAKVNLRCCMCCNENIRMLQAYASSVFRRMFQVFHLDVAYVAIALPACFNKRVFQVFHTFHTYVVSVSSRCCKSRSGCCICCYAYTRMFQVFYLFQTYVTNVSSGCFKSRSKCCTIPVAGG